MCTGRMGRKVRLTCPPKVTLINQASGYKRVRLFSTRALKPLGTLEYHKKSIQALIFARDIRAIVNEDDSEDEMTTEEKVERSRWLIVGSQDNRASVWPLISFEKTG